MSQFPSQSFHSGTIDSESSSIDHASSARSTERFEAAEAVVSSSVESRPAPTVYVTYGSRSVKARIDREVPLDEIIAQLVNSQQLAVAEPAALFALRDKDTGALVTEDNLSKYLDQGTASFTLCSSPVIEAVEIVDELRSSEPGALKLATFSLRTLIKEPAFLDAFLARGGLDAVQDVVRRASGNTLAYALLSLQNLLELEDRGWQGLDEGFVARIVQIIATEPLINIVRPATAILRRLSMQTRTSSMGRDSIDGGATPRLGSTTPTPADTNTSSSGFATVYNMIQQRSDFMPIVVGRLSSGDLALALLSLGLINSLFRGATELGDERYAAELDKLGANKIVGDLLEAWKDSGDLSAILAYQANVISSLHAQFVTPVDEAHYGLFDDIWSASGINESDVDVTTRWQTLGFKSESPQVEFESTGVLGLKTLVAYTADSDNEFATTLKETLARAPSRRCPLATVSSAVVLALAEHFHVVEGVSPNPTTPNPHVLRFNQCHALATHFFTRMWIESGATETDFERVATLMKSQVAHVLANVGGEAGETKSWEIVKDEFLRADYRDVRDRQMRELEIEDDVLSKAPVRHLRGRLYLESFEFVRNQRIACLHEGAWFRIPNAATTAGSLRRHVSHAISLGGTTSKKWRFCRLAANRKALHYVEMSERVPIAPGLDDLGDRIDVALITDVVPTGASPTSNPRDGASGAAQRSAPSIASSSNASRTNLPSPPPRSLSFALHSAEGVLAEFIAPDMSTYSEWIDGLSLLRPEGSIISSQTAEYVHALTEIGVKVKLLDLSGEKVEIPSKIEVRHVPADQGQTFHYSENL